MGWLSVGTEEGPAYLMRLTPNSLWEPIDYLVSDPTIRRATFWTAFVLMGYYSALRSGDLL